VRGRNSASNEKLHCRAHVRVITAIIDSMYIVDKDLILEGPRRTPVRHYLRGTTVPCGSACEPEHRQLAEDCYFTYPTNFNAVMALDFSAFKTLSVTNSH
jgi:hypothetical protein